MDNSEGIATTATGKEIQTDCMGEANEATARDAS